MTFWETYEQVAGQGHHPPTGRQLATRRTQLDGYLVGVDAAGHAVVVIESEDRDGPRRVASRLGGLEVSFDLEVELVEAGVVRRVRCTVAKSTGDELVQKRFFLAAFDAVARVVGSSPSASGVSDAIDQLAEIFRRLSQPSRRSTIGFIAELVFILSVDSQHEALQAWRQADDDRFDFIFEGFRVDLKATSSNSRVHFVTYEQCNPPDAVPTYFVSAQLALTGGGTSCAEIFERVLDACEGDASLELKVQSHMVDCAEGRVEDLLESRFDFELAQASLTWFDASEVPAVRGDLPGGVSSLRFASDFSIARPAEPAR